MAKYKSITITNAGLAIIAAAQSGDSIRFTSIKSGNGVYDGTESLADMTDLKSVQQTFGITGITRENSKVKIRSVFTNEGVTEGYYITEVGLYATNPETDAEVLYAVVVAESGKEDYLPAYSEAPQSITMEMYIDITNLTEGVVFEAAIVAGTYVTVEDFAEYSIEIQNVLDNIDTAVDNVMTSVDNLSIEVSDIETDVDNLTSKVNNIEIGGRNLLAYSSLRNGDYNGASAQVRVSVDIENRHYIEAGQVITLSSTSDELIKWLAITDENNSPVETLILSGSEKLYTVTVTKSGYLTPIFGKYNSEGGWDIMTVDFVKSCNVKIEKGNKPTDWTPAPEDMTTKAESDDLKMLGWTVPNECPIQNYVDSNRVYHQRVGRVDLGSLTWSKYTAWGSNTTFNAGLTNGAFGTAWNKLACFCNRYAVTSHTIVLNGTANGIGTRDDTKEIFICDTSYTDATAFKESMQGVYMYYELETEITCSVDGNEKIVELDKSDIIIEEGTTFLYWHYRKHKSGRLELSSIYNWNTPITVSSGVSEKYITIPPMLTQFDTSCVVNMNVDLSGNPGGVTLIDVLNNIPNEHKLKFNVWSVNTLTNITPVFTIYITGFWK